MSVRKILLLLVLGLVCLAPFATTPALAYEGVSVKHAHRHTVQAQRELHRAQAVLSEARAVERATRTYSSQYGSTVGRWVWLSNDVGWPRAQWGTLFFVIDRESGGFPGIDNPSGAAGLMQLMPGWWAGTYYGSMPDFNPHDPRLNLKYGLWGWKVDGWRPWSL